MKVYKCLITGDELFTDSYPIENKDGIYKVKGKFVSRAGGIDESKLGANPSAEEAAETNETVEESGVNVVLDNRLQPTGFGTKKEYMAYFKDFVKLLEAKHKENNPDMDVAAWRTSIQEAFKKVSAEFKEYEFFTGESSDPTGTIALMKWETPEGEMDQVPYLYFYVQATREEKV